ncbi:MAG: ATP synthase F1 subunit gamma [Treponema sp.]|jgi:F-type H+-transporting ATPase subunit gamma|nr:ATP synthase F1 subunit gamma [Treponema sp.]
MANLKDVRLRMRAIEQTLQVTKAMNLISTAKLRKGRRMLEETKPYFDRIQKSVFDIFSDAGRINSIYFRDRTQIKKYRTAIIAITSDRGLAGGYNANIFRQVNELCSRVENPLLILIGNMGYRYFCNTPHVILENFQFCSQVPTVEYADEISKYILSQYLLKVFDEIHIVYTHMFSSVRAVPVERQLVPNKKKKIQQEIMKLGNLKRIDLRFDFIPSSGEVFDALVPHYLKGLIFCCMVEAYASEQSARMSAMNEASKSAEDMLAELRINYNRTRQAGITQEISEVVGGII